MTYDVRMRHRPLIRTLSLAATTAFCIACQDGPPPSDQPPASQEEAERREVPSGFEVPGGTLVLRAMAPDNELDHASEAMETLGTESLDRVKASRRSTNQSVDADSVGIAHRCQPSYQRGHSGF